MPPMPVTVLEVQPTALPTTIELMAQTEGAKETEVRARVGGILLKRLYVEGTPVKAGQPMFQIDPAPYENALAEARARAGLVVMLGHDGLARFERGLVRAEDAIAVAERNRALNGLAGAVEWRCGNAFDVLRDLEREGRRYDVVVMDPPPFAPSKDRIDSARRGYKDLALRAFRLLDNRGALLFLSCSHAFGRDILLDTLGEAARDAKRRIVVAGEIHQPADHPRVPEIPETDYLKGFLCAVDFN